MRPCTVCGNPVEPAARFCSTCGADLMTVVREGYCPTCHHVRPAAADGTCATCHRPLLDLHAVSPAPAATPLPPPPAVATVVAAPAPVMQPTPPRLGMAVRVGVAAAALIGLVAYGIVRFTASDDTTGQPSGTTAVGTTAPGSPATTASGGGGSAATTVPGGVPVTPAPTASGGGKGIVVLSSNAYMQEGGLSIDGEDRTLYFVAAVRNDTGAKVEVDDVKITVRDAAGKVIGTRFDHLIDSILDPGEVSYLYEFTPSMMYRSDETNTYPEGWKSWSLSITTKPYDPSDYEEVNLTIEAPTVTPSGAPVHATGTIVNTTSRTVSASSIEVYVALYDSHGALVNVGWTFADSKGLDTLAPGASTTFRVDVSFGPKTYAKAVVGAVGTTEA